MPPIARRRQSRGPDGRPRVSHDAYLHAIARKKIDSADSDATLAFLYNDMRPIGSRWVKQPDSDIGRFVRERRKVRGWSQQELADYAGVSRTLVSDLEIGKPTMRMDAVNVVLALFGKHLGVVDLAAPGSRR